MIFVLANLPCSTFSQEAGNRSGPRMANDQVKNLQNEVEGVKNIMTQNVERILARGENLDHLRNKTEDLEATVSSEIGGGGGETVGERWRGRYLWNIQAQKDSCHFPQWCGALTRKVSTIPIVKF